MKNMMVITESMCPELNYCIDKDRYSEKCYLGLNWPPIINSFVLYASVVFS